MGRLHYVPAIKWQVMSISGVNYLVPAGGEGIAVDVGRGDYILLKPDGDVQLTTGDITMSSEATVDGFDVSDLSSVYSPKDYYGRKLGSDIATNGTTEVDLDFTTLLGTNGSYITYEPDEDDGVFEFQKGGVHSISCTLTTDVTTNNLRLILKLYYRPDGTSAWTQVTSRGMHTSTNARTQVNLVNYVIEAAEGDQIKFTGSLSLSAGATNFVGDMTNCFIKALSIG